MTFAHNLRAAMDRAGVSQSELARRLGIRSQAVNQWLKAGGTAPRGARLLQVAAALNVGLVELLGKSEGTPLPAETDAGYGKRLTLTRIERGRTESDFAADIGVPVELLKLWETEALALDQAALVKLWRAGISADWILFGEKPGVRQHPRMTTPRVRQRPAA